MFVIAGAAKQSSAGPERPGLPRYARNDRSSDYGCITRRTAGATPDATRLSPRPPVTPDLIRGPAPVDVRKGLRIKPPLRKAERPGVKVDSVAYPAGFGTILMPAAIGWLGGNGSVPAGKALAWNT